MNGLGDRTAVVDWGERVGRGCSIADVVARSDVPSSSIHYYVRLGLVPPPERMAPNRFVYDDRHVRALGIVRALRRRGRTLDEIQQAMPQLWPAADERGEAAVTRYVQQHSCVEGPRARLIDAAIAASAARGFRAVSVARLCDRADVAKGTFYRYFPNKDALFLAAARAVVDRAVTDFTREVEAGTVANHAASFAHHLRPGLPLLFDLAKQSVQDSGPMARAAASLFVSLVERLGRAVRADDGVDAAQAGAFVVMLALVEIFNRLLESEMRSTITATAG